MDIPISQVYKTNEYSKFKFLPENRQVNQRHVERLMESFQQKYIPNPIIVNEYGHVIDGQNRLTAAMNLKMPVYYIVIDGLTAADIAPLNFNAKNWKISDYLNFHLTQGYNPIYKLIKQYQEKHPVILHSHLYILLLGVNKRSKAGKNMIDFYKGDISELLTTRDVAIEAYERFLERKTHMSVQLCTLINYFSMISVFDWNRFFERLKLYGRFERQPTTEKYVYQFNDVYNYYLRKDVVDLVSLFNKFNKIAQSNKYNDFREIV